jgi:hypothetical protein
MFFTRTQLSFIGRKRFDREASSQIGQAGASSNDGVSGAEKSLHAEDQGPHRGAPLTAYAGGLPKQRPRIPQLIREK